MLSLSRKSDYALVALAHLGQRWRDQLGPTSARQIAAGYGMPVSLLMNVLKDLARARIVTSTRGAQGGYALSGDPAGFSLLEVITAIDGQPRFAQCTDGLPIMGQGCTIACECPIRTPIRRLHAQLQRFLESVTLEDLLDDNIVTPNTSSRLTALMHPGCKE